MAPNDFVDRVSKVARAFMESQIIIAGVQLELFDRLSSGPASSDTLAQDLRVTRRGIEILSDALVACGYLTKEDNRYRNTAEVDRFLVRGRPESMAFITGHHGQMFRSWAYLEKIIRFGKEDSERSKATLTDPVANRNFILGMAEVSRERMGPILDRLPLDRTKTFVDLGGGPAQYACEAVRRHPDLQATLVDLPLTVAVAQEQIAAAGLSHRVATLVCDFYHEEELGLENPVDGVLISQVLHAEGPEENISLLKKVHASIKPGGWIAISENLVEESRTAPLPGAMFAVNMLAGTVRGRTYTEGEIADWLTRAGFKVDGTNHVAERAWLTLARKADI